MDGVPGTSSAPRSTVSIVRPGGEGGTVRSEVPQHLCQDFNWSCLVYPTTSAALSEFTLKVFEHAWLGIPPKDLEQPVCLLRC